MARLGRRPFLLAFVTLVLVDPTAGESPGAGTEAAPPKVEESRTDFYGDPLPPGAIARLGTVRWRARIACCLAYSRDGKVLATGNSDFTIRLWDPATGEEIRRFTGHRGQVECVAL